MPDKRARANTWAGDSGPMRRPVEASRPGDPPAGHMPIHGLMFYVRVGWAG